MSKIKYDMEVLAVAKRILQSPTATRGDMLRLIEENEHRPWLKNKKSRDRMPSSNYLGKEAISEILTMAHSLPNRVKKPKINYYR